MCAQLKKTSRTSERVGREKGEKAKKTDRELEGASLKGQWHACTPASPAWVDVAVDGRNRKGGGEGGGSSPRVAARQQQLTDSRVGLPTAVLAMRAALVSLWMRSCRNSTRREAKVRRARTR